MTVLGRSICGELSSSYQREWLLTNGLGSFASGTVAGLNTRRYHGFLVAALKPPVERTLLVSSVDIDVTYLDKQYSLSCHEFADGTLAPQGFSHIQAFYLYKGLPVWHFAFADVLLECRMIMVPQQHTSYLQLKVLRASSLLQVTARPMCTYRDYHSHHANEDWLPTVIREKYQYLGQSADGFVVSSDNAQPYRLLSSSGQFEPNPQWYWSFLHRVESFRGLDDTEHLFIPGVFTADLHLGKALTIIATTETDIAVLPSFTDAEKRVHNSLQPLLDSLPDGSPHWIQQLVRASDQFIVDRQHQGETLGKTVLAGYPWFSDWGRDTMIALPGLTLCLGRFAEAGSIIRTFASHLYEGMIPNRFPDQSVQQPEYNTVDATLWFIHTVREYATVSGDLALVEDIFPHLVDIVQWHLNGTRFHIKVDPADGLLFAGEQGVQLTWMDAKVGDWVVTPRIGKAVEINALWYNALCCMVELADSIGVAGDRWSKLASTTKQSFQRFWNNDSQCLYDVIDTDASDSDASIRPNQLFAVSLPFSPLPSDQAKKVVDCCARQLVTSYGLRSLSNLDASYQGDYQGDQRQRDGAYHQGTVWSWLLGPFVEAHYRVYQDIAQASSYLQPIEQHLNEACIGSISEVFEGDAPHAARGCIAQAWSVAEVLRVWLMLEDAKK